MRRIPALDGLRGVAILLVVVFHAWPPLMRGGAYGVTLFFTLSGFLITGILLKHPVSWAFYQRRAVRLLPGLLIVAATFLLLGGSWSDTWPALTYTANWVAAARGTLGHMMHTWSLAVEEHFYLTWPFILYVIPARIRFRATATLVGAAGVWRVWLLATQGPTPRLDVGTDTSAVALLAGCLLAVAHFEGRRIPARGGVAATAGIVALSVVLPKGSVGWHWAWFLVVACAFVAVNAAASRPIRVLEASGLTGLGVISYGVYLWHGIVLGLTFIPTWFAVAVSVVLAAGMWRWVESPLLAWERNRSVSSSRPPRPSRVAVQMEAQPTAR